MSSNGTAAFYRRTRLLGIAGLVFAASLIFLRSGQPSRSPTLNEPFLSLAHSATAPQTLRSASTKPIEEIRIGDRVLARNPEVSDAERQHWHDPDWTDWLHLSLIMSKPDGSEVNIELLRPESWVLGRVSFATDNWNLSGACPDFGATSQIGEKQSWHLLELDLPQAKEDCSVPFSPLRPVFRGIALTLAQRQTTDDDFPGVTVQVDLPEMGASGTPFVRAVNPCPPIRSGEGQPVTATFAHRSTTPILDVVFEGESKPIGVTDNHLFWSIDRQRFIPIGQMAIGERVQTHSGETKRIEGRLPRPGPQVVYNLEVYGEHVYFVGQQGVLAHNLYEANGNVVYRDAYDELLHSPKAAAPVGTHALKDVTDFSEQLGISHNRARARLRSALGSSAPNQAHHIIPWQTRSHELIQRAARGGFNINGVENGISLARTQHLGSHPKYNSAIIRKLDELLVNNPGLSDAQYADLLRGYVNRLRNGLERSESMLH
ncbi:AHH domain-containing protein [Roseiconus lacunae]|uniref:AHH domain-containing protein n=1 Tax=Roseiconus lacunae TaxID=2605694 RepID=A0ABT7PHB7_9BACT|nr:AHH domain-containing protein [Roseiconus lacunae]MDM4015897.1 AHH domain-containing protein [Roseiconus lacunae]